MCLPFSRRNGHWMVAEMRLKSTFPVTIQSTFRHHSVTIQSTERWDFILWMFVRKVKSFIMAFFLAIYGWMADFETKIFVAADVIFKNDFCFYKSQKGSYHGSFNPLFCLLHIFYSLFTVIKLLPYFFYITFHRS